MFHSLTHHSSHPDIDSDKTQQVGPCLRGLVFISQCISVCLSCMYLDGLDYSGAGQWENCYECTTCICTVSVCLLMAVMNW